MRLVLVGTSHHHAPVELRERVALDRRARVARLRRRSAKPSASRRATARSSTSSRRTPTTRSGGPSRRSPRSSREVEPALYRLRDQAAALHLFRVAAGLDSLVPGEGEILGQVRAAHEVGHARAVMLDRVFRQALHAGRKVRAQTAIGESPASVSSAAAALAEQVFGDLDGPHASSSSAPARSASRPRATS